MAFASPVAARERALQLDPEAIAPPERGVESPRDRRRIRELAARNPSRDRSLARAPRQAHEPLRMALDVLDADLRLRGGLRSARRAPLARAPVRLGEQQAEVVVAGGVLAQERQVVAVVERYLGARDRPDSQRLCGLGELHRAIDPVV